MPSSCVEEKERSCVLLVVIVIPRWRSLCGRSCVYIVEILLCEGRDVKQWLEPRNKFLYLHLHLSLSFFYLVLPYIAYITYMLGIVYVPTLVFNQESF